MNPDLNIKDIYTGLTEYIINHMNFESNDVINDITIFIKRANSIEEVFKLPINTRLFSFSDSIKWTFFIYITLKYMEEHFIPIPQNFNIYFNLKESFDYINNTYTHSIGDLIEYYTDIN